MNIKVAIVKYNNTNIKIEPAYLSLKEGKSQLNIPKSWNFTSEEKKLLFPCDKLNVEFDFSETYYRGITINASAEIIFKWLCQLRIAPYSYDFIDNSGRKSPQYLLNDQPELVVGQSALLTYEIINFEINKHITLGIKQDSSYPLTNLAVSYLIIPKDSKTCRLLVKCNCKYKKGISAYIAKKFLLWGDLVMMRKQLLNFKKLSESYPNILRV